MITFIQQHATQVISFLTLLSNIIFVGVIIAMVLHSETRRRLSVFIHTYILELLFWAVIAAVVGSLAYSNIIGFPPCDLCWYQRIFMYPQAIILFIAMLKKDKKIINYLLPLSIIGACIALFHTLVQWGLVGGSVLACTDAGGACARVYVNEYSYITIPFMSLCVFVYIIVMKYIYYRTDKTLKNAGK